MTSDTESGDWVLLAAGTKTYRYRQDFDPPLDNLKVVRESLRRVVDTLTGLGYRSEQAGALKYLLDPSPRDLMRAVRAAASSGLTVVLYYTGHGIKPDQDTYWLITTDARPNQLEETALQASRLRNLVLRKDRRGNTLPEDDQPDVLLILDCCFSEAGGIEALHDSLQDIGNPKVWVLASASKLQYAQDGKFAEALREALLNPEVGPSQKLLNPFSVTREINRVLKEVGQTASLAAPGGRSTGEAPFFPNPTYTPNIAGRTLAEQKHWVSRLRGTPTDITKPGLYVTGRTGRMKVVKDLAQWMRSTDRYGLAVVTGSPGSGKSAMLALPVLLAGGQSRDALITGADPRSLVAHAVDRFAGLTVLGIHAQGMNPYDVARDIAKLLGRSADSPDELLADLDDRAETSSRIIVVDAIDEARDPPQMLNNLLRPLSRRPMLRVVIGTRRHLAPPAADTSLLVDLDSDEYCDPQALADYAHQLLIAAHEPDAFTPYRDHDDVAVKVATEIAKKATERSAAIGRAESFLLAQLLARAVRGRKQLLDVTRAEQLPADLGTAFDEDLRRLGKHEPAARALMTALAWAKGPGMPWETIWVPVARALASWAGAGTLRLERSDVRWLLDNAAAYIVEDLGPGATSVFRPFHNLIASHLRGAPGHTGRHRREAETAIYNALLDVVPDGGKTLGDWVAAHPYLHAYLAQHAAGAGTSTLAELAKNKNYLAVADPVTLGALLSPAVPELRSAAQTYRRARPMLGEDPYANATHLQGASRTLTGAAAESKDNVRSLLPGAHTRSALKDDSIVVLTGHDAPVNSVAFGSTINGQLLLASASDDQTVRLWDPITGAPIGKPLTGHNGGVSSVAFGATTGGQPLLASASWDGTVRLWDPITGAPIGKPLTGHNGGVSSVAFGATTGGQSLLASGGDDQTVRLWRSDDSAPSGETLTGHNGWVGSVAFGATTGGQSLLASGGDDQTVRLWRSDDSAPSGEPLTGHNGWVAALAFARGEPLLASASSDGTVRLWNLDDSAPSGEPLTGHNGWVAALAFARGEPLLASASSDGTVRLWNLDDSAPSGEPLRGHYGGVSAVAFGKTDCGQLLLASGGDDQTVRLWDPITGALSGRGGWVGLPTSRITATGRPVIASAS